MYRGDERVLNIAQTVHTDDRGEYRLFSLVPGRYFVAVRPEDPGRRTATLNVVPPGRRGPYEHAVSPVVTKRILPSGEILEETQMFVYYGATTDARRAAPLNLAPGALIGAVDIPMAVGKTRALHIRGKILEGVGGNPAAGAAVRLIPRTFSSFLIVPTTTTNAAGEFDLTGVVPGAYYLYSLGAVPPQRPPAPGVPPPPPPPLLTAMLPLEVANDHLDNVTLVITPSATVGGRLAVEGNANIDPARLFVTLEAVPTGAGTVTPVFVQVAGNGTFNLTNVWPADYRVLLQNVPAGAYVKSLRLGPLDLLQDLLKVPVQTSGALEILIGTDTGTLEGRAVNDRQESVPNVKVALVPDAPLRRRGDLYKSGATDMSGNFRFVGVAPGSYKVFAWEDVEDGAWRDPEVLRLDESRGRPVRIVGERAESVNVTVIPTKR
jgi:protocatechuate 3,4-dioxygenase beta subunit